MCLRRSTFAVTNVRSDGGKCSLDSEPVPVLTSSTLALWLPGERWWERKGERKWRQGWQPGVRVPVETQACRISPKWVHYSFYFNTFGLFPLCIPHKTISLTRAQVYCHFNWYQADTTELSGNNAGKGKQCPSQDRKAVWVGGGVSLRW